MNESLFEIRRAIPIDAEAVLSLERQLAEYTGCDMSGFALTEADIFALLLEQQSREEGGSNHQAHRTRIGPHIFIAETVAERTPAGVVVASVMPQPSWAGARPVYVEDLITARAFRGRGVGAMLLGAISQEAILATRDPWGRPDPAKAGIRLSTHAENNEDTRAFYERVGFETDRVEYHIGGTALVQLALRAQI